MSRHTVTVRSTSQTDEDAVIGYDPPFRSFFLTAFPNEETDDNALWLGGLLEEYPSLEGIIEAATAHATRIQVLPMGLSFQ
jgi:hypothetical protein